MSQPGDHFDIDAWVDFARDLSPTDRRKAMQHHAALCAACSEIAAFFKKVWQAGQEMKSGTVPADWSRKAEQILRDNMLEPIRLLPVRTALLAFDSFTAITPLQVRASSGSSRHLTYETDDCALDLQIDDRRNATTDVFILGQITNRRTPALPVPAIHVLLLSGEKVLASASSNDFGEFQLACKPKRRMRISFPFEGSRVDVRLDDLLNEESAHL